jgi:flagellar biogenesis protein FliO
VKRHGERCVACRILPLLVMLMFMLAAAGIVSAQTTRPAPVSDYAGQMIRRGGGPEAPTTARASSTAEPIPAKSRGPQQFLDLPRVLLSLVIVLAIVFVLRWIVRKLLPNTVGARKAAIVKVLARSPVTTRQQVLLLQVGKRVLVVADNGTQMNPLSEITDSDEVATLIGQLSPAAAADREAFNAALGEAEKDYEAEQSSDEPKRPPDPIHADEPPANLELSGLMEKVRGLAKQLGR